MKIPFGNSGMVGGTVGVALLCYTISIGVSTERSGVERLQRQVVADTRDIRALEAELSTRARKPVLQRWNDNVLGLGAPLPKQFAADAYELAAYAPGAPVAQPLQPAPEMQQAVARDDSQIAPVAPQRAGLQTIAYIVPAVSMALPPKIPAAAKRADPLAGLLDDIDTASVPSRGGLAK